MKYEVTWTRKSGWITKAVFIVETQTIPEAIHMTRCVLKAAFAIEAEWECGQVDQVQGP